jgi:hypothetical protein
MWFWGRIYTIIWTDRVRNEGTTKNNGGEEYPKKDKKK